MSKKTKFDIFERASGNLRFHAVPGTPYHWRLTHSPNYRRIQQAVTEEKISSVTTSGGDPKKRGPGRPPKDKNLK
jgi:hypothetical protein